MTYGNESRTLPLLVGALQPGGRFRPHAILTAAVAFTYAVVVLASTLPSAAFPWRDGIGAMAAATEKLPARSTAARLSGGFVYKPFLADLVADRRDIRRVVTRVAENVREERTVETLHASGIALLLQRKGDAAVAVLEEALQQDAGVSGTAAAIGRTRNAALLSDLCAAYVLRQEISREARDVISAVEAAATAWRIERTPEIAWNRALAIQALGPREDAIAAWDDYLSLDAGSEWADEARARAGAAKGATDTRQWELEKASIVATAGVDEIRRIAAAFPQYARAFAEDEVLPAWGSAVLLADRAATARQLTIATAIASELAANGDLLLADSVRGAQNARPTQLLALARGHESYGKARRLHASGVIEEAGKEYERAALLLRGGEGPFELFARFQVAVCRYMRNEYGDAGRRLVELDELPQRRRYASLSGRIAWVRGLVEEQSGHPAPAFERYRTALETFVALEEKDHQAALLTMMAETLHRMGEDEAALEHHLRAVSIIAATGSSSRRHQVLFEAAFAALEQRRLETAELLLNRVLVTDRKAPVPTDACVTLIWRSVVHSLRGASERAGADLSEANTYCAAIPDPRVRERAMANFALAALTARSPMNSLRATETTKAITFFEATNSKLWLPGLLSERAAAYHAKGEPALAEHDLLRGIEEAELAESRVRHASSITGAAVEALYQSMIALCIGQQRFDDALEYADRANRRTISALFGRAQGVDVRFGRKETTRDRVVPRLQAALPPKTVVANFFQLPDRLLIWTIRNDSVGFHQVAISADAFAGLATEFGAEPGAVSRLASTSVAPDISKVLLGAWIGGVGKDETIIVAGEASVRVLPLAALVHPAKGGFLVQHAALATAPTLSALLTAMSADSARRLPPKVLLVAASTPDTRVFPDLAFLPASEREIRAVARAHEHPTILTRERARKVEFLGAAQDATLVHFAGHAASNERAPLFSALVLSATGAGHPEDEILYMHEVTVTTFPVARLVVLTACNTAREARPNVSFATALLELEIPSVVSNIWDAEDRAASVFGALFHTALERGESRAAALRGAQLAMLNSSDRSLSKPAAWSGYQLAGAFGPLSQKEY